MDLFRQYALNTILESITFPMNLEEQEQYAEWLSSQLPPWEPTDPNTRKEIIRGILKPLVERLERECREKPTF